jgi:hypothetical protein
VPFDLSLVASSVVHETLPSRLASANRPATTAATTTHATTTLVPCDVGTGYLANTKQNVIG